MALWLWFSDCESRVKSAPMRQKSGGSMLFCLLIALLVMFPAIVVASEKPLPFIVLHGKLIQFSNVRNYCELQQWHKQDNISFLLNLENLGFNSI